MPTLELGPLALASLLAGHGLRKKSLSPSGAGAAFVVGYIMLGGGAWIFGVSLISFYLLGSRATKFGKARKAQLEDEYHVGGYGYRSGWQVLSNSFAALVAALIWNAAFAPASLPAWIAGDSAPDAPVYDGQWCPIDSSIAEGWSRRLLFVVLGHFACCLGDTLASELGILSQGRPILITTLQPVPPGTNGGVSRGGTLASIAGGATMGLVMAACLVAESPACRATALPLFAQLTAVGALCGGGGSLLDSLLGATIQETRYSEERKLVSDRGAHLVGLNLLSNNQVNVVSSIVTAVVAGWLAV
ncbi:integral membrane protein DUF92-domain-containing protein [Schizophyllum amplum]|uniref:Integral membrane protein DUF92-domain-containing protein n=1 Tax=Schizophyllum amplum TaxID=97359 RepID=A0A550CPD3_9AGAR|nr:integral membrane protein DUF92-domain-containing protein [Auriculariopsis ampla]